MGTVWRNHPKLVLGILVFALLLIASVAVPQSAAALGKKFFDDTSAGSCDVSSCNTTKIDLMDADTRYVSNYPTNARAYFTSNRGTVVIKGGNYCPGQSGNPDSVETEDYKGIANGARITKFTFGAGGTQKVRWGNKNTGCNNDMSVSFTGLSKEEGTDYYFINIRVTHEYPGGVDGTQNAYNLVATGSNAFAVTNQAASKKGEDVTVQQSAGPLYNTYFIRFGTRCDLQSSSERGLLASYDLDNDLNPSGAQRGRKITMRLYRMNENGGNRRLIQSWTPQNGDGAYSNWSFNFEKNMKYEWQIINVYENNTIQYSAPYNGINYFPCSDKWKMEVDTTGGGTTVRRGDTMRWTHTVKNAGPDRTDRNVSGDVEWSAGTTGPGASRGSRISGTNYNQRFNNNQTRTYNTSFRVPNNAQNNQRYCQSINATPRSASNNNRVDSAQRCYTVYVPPTPNVPTENVNIRPDMQAPGGDIEPTETSNFNGRVNVSNFPEMTEWGYTERAQQLRAQRVQASGRSTLQSQSRGPYTATGSYSAPYYNTNCRYVRGVWTCDKVYYCYGGAWLSGSTCRYTYTYYEYRYRCEYGSWGAWNGGAPSCMQWWTCPGGAAGGNKYAWSAPTCDGWQCQYPSAQINQRNEPECEARCNGGRGDRAPRALPPYYKYYDINCYQQPSFTISCYWDSGYETTQRVNSNGDYCQRTETREGEYIGQLLCAEIGAEVTSDWTSPPPGWGTTNGSTYRLLKDWRMQVSPETDQDCVRVVGRPTVKVTGGDVAAGGNFTSSGICTAGPSASVTGWPHATSYDASGSEYGVFASGTVYGFASAMVNSNMAYTPNRLTFANTSAGGEYFGGNFGTMPCIPDYAGTKPTEPMPTVNLSSIGAAGLEGSYNGSGQINSNPTIQRGKHLTVYVTGNVYISSNVYYERSGWTKPSDIPAFKLVVTGGNIYIAPGVTELNGVYIAQPSGGGAGGNIYTCASSSSPISNTSLFNSCGNDLKVNGAFIARKVHLLRSGGTAIFGDTAEQFNYLPELWLADWPDDQETEQSKYDSINSLPPVL